MPLSSLETVALNQQYVIQNYTRYPISLVRGEGSCVWDAEGKRYLDFFPGWGCNLLGYCPPHIVKAIQEQAAKLIHVPNTWHTEQQAVWAKMISERSFDGMGFFCNSGAEANEAAIKLTRLHSPKRHKIITFLGSFHGRTMGAISATAQPKYHEGLHPLLAGFVYVPYNDLAAVEKAIDDETAAIMIEPILGEGGIKIPDSGFLQGLRSLCDKHNMLLIFDEVQSGFARTGNWFAYQHFGVEPDIMTLAKAICGGMPGGAMFCKREIAPSLRPGMHASTYGGNPVVAAAGIAAIEMIENEGLLEKARLLGEHFRNRFEKIAAQNDVIKEIRVLGGMIGVELYIDGVPFVKACMEKGLLINCTQGNVLRFLPAINMTHEQADEGIDIVLKALSLCDA